MRRIIYLIVIMLGTAVFAQTADAHAIWIESNTTAKKNSTHPVKIVYGDYAEGVIEPTSKWYSDLGTLEVWVTSPSKKKTKLALTNADDHLASSFVTDEDGLYLITTVHATKDLGGTTKYEFSSVAPVLSGKANADFSAISETLSVTVKPKVFKAGEVVELQVRNGIDPFANATVQVMSPQGWVKTIKTDDKGLISFTPRLKGDYIIEASEHKKDAGEWNGKQHTHVWKGSTAHLLVQ